MDLSELVSFRDISCWTYPMFERRGISRGGIVGHHRSHVLALARSFCQVEIKVVLFCLRYEDATDRFETSSMEALGEHFSVKETASILL